MSEYTKWYSIGRVQLTKNSPNVVGTDTYWANVSIKPGDIFTTDGTKIYQVASITDNTHLTLRSNYAEASTSSAEYSIIRNFSSSTQSEISARTIDLLGTLRTYLDNDMETIRGKSAYELAVENGYSGTLQQWLESLIGAGEWTALRETMTTADSALSTRIDTAQTSANNALTRAQILSDSANSPIHMQAGYHNHITRGKNLGTSITSAQWNAIISGSFTDMFLGDYWEIGGMRHYIVHFDYMFNMEGIAGRADWGAAGNDPNGDPFVTEGMPVINELLLYPHHLVLMPDIGFGVGDMNSTEDAGKAYGVSTYRRVKRKEIIEQLETMFGANHLLYWTEELVSALGPYNGDANDYAPSARAAFSCQAELPSVFQLTGIQPSMLNGSTWAGGHGDATLYGGQFALMRLCSAFSRPIDFTSSLGGYYVGLHTLTRDVRNAGPGQATYFRWCAGTAGAYSNSMTYRPYYIIK